MVASGWRRSPGLRMSSQMEATIVSSQGRDAYQGWGAVARKKMQVTGSTKQRRWSAQTRAVASAGTVGAGARAVDSASLMGVLLTYGSVCEQGFPHTLP